MVELQNWGLLKSVIWVGSACPYWVYCYENNEGKENMEFTPEDIKIELDRKLGI